jgi:predicted transcriptional regulator
MALTSRIEIRADEDFIKALEELSSLTNKNRADVIRDALSLYSIAIKERIDHHRGIVFQDLKTVPSVDLVKSR